MEKNGGKLIVSITESARGNCPACPGLQSAAIIDLIIYHNRPFMYYSLRALLLCSGLLLCCTVLSAQTDTLDYQQECRMRQGMPNFFAKLKAGSPVTIAYFGGSITAAGGGWRDQSYQWFSRTFPKAKITQVNAGVGGTGSDLGAFRLRRDVLEHNPDLVFVEFAVNDGGGNPDRIHQTMEGIVRQIWKEDAGTDICFVYTIAGNMLPVLSEGRLWPSMLAMEHIAQHYGIPSVQFGLKVLALLQADKLVFQGKQEEHPGKLVFSGDNVHPNNHTGHRLYTEALIRAMEQMKAKDRPARHKLMQPFTEDNWEDAQMLPLTGLPRSGNWQDLSGTQDSVAQQLRHRFPFLLKSAEPGAALTIRFKGRLMGLYDVIGPGCGQYAVTIDKGPEKLYPRFDRHAVYYRASYFFLPLMEKGEHAVEMRVSARAPDKMAILKQGSNASGDPGKYRENACYAGWLLVLGQLVN